MQQAGAAGRGGGPRAAPAAPRAAQAQVVRARGARGGSRADVRVRRLRLAHGQADLCRDVLPARAAMAQLGVARRARALPHPRRRGGHDAQGVRRSGALGRRARAPGSRRRAARGARVHARCRERRRVRHLRGRGARVPEGRLRRLVRRRRRAVVYVRRVERAGEPAAHLRPRARRVDARPRRAAADRRPRVGVLVHRQHGGDGGDAAARAPYRGDAAADVGARGVDARARRRGGSRARHLRRQPVGRRAVEGRGDAGAQRGARARPCAAACRAAARVARAGGGAAAGAAR